MPPWLTIDRALTTDGGDMTLSVRGAEYVIRVDGQDLMHSFSHGSEDKLAVYGCAGLRAKPRARVLIGGLGMGFTARAALGVLAADAAVEVVELVGAVVRWNRDVFGHLAGAPLADARLGVIEGDVAATIAGACARYDAILLDVDNGPAALTTFGNKRLYAEEGLRAAARALRSGGVLAVWSLFEDARFSARLRAAGFQVTVKRVTAGDGSSRRHVLWLARPPAPAS
jgi:spermidine synthase